MNSIKMSYLFPFGMIPPKSNVLIYGAGKLGREYLSQMILTGYGNVLGFIDKNFRDYSFLPRPVYPLEKILELEYDYVLIALVDSMLANNVKEKLIEIGIPNEKIVIGSNHEKVEESPIPCSLGGNYGKKYAFQISELSIAISLAPGLGDHIACKKFVLHLISLEPNCRIDIWSANATEYVPVIYGKNENLYSAHNSRIESYALVKDGYALSIFWDYIIRIDSFLKLVILKQSPKLGEFILNLEHKINEDNIAMFDGAWRSVLMNRARYKRNYIYNGIYHMNEFALPDSFQNNVEIQLLPTYEEKFKDLKVKNYITLNYGNGQKSSDAAKQWPYEYFCEFAKIFHKQYPQYTIVQIGATDSHLISNCDMHFFGYDLELIKYVLKDAMFHLDIEGGLVHLATQLNTRCIVIFGPTPVTFFGYSENVNIVSNACNGCSYLYGGGSWVCARNMIKPLCMYSITPDIVMQRVCEFLDSNRLKGCLDDYKS